MGEIIDESIQRFLAADAEDGGVRSVELIVVSGQPEIERIYIEETPEITATNVLVEAGISTDDPNFRVNKAIVVAAIARAIETEEFVAPRRKRARALNNLPIDRAIRRALIHATLDPKE
jgi:hypothetical protein